jgi:hypothetical protein
VPQFKESVAVMVAGRSGACSIVVSRAAERTNLVTLILRFSMPFLAICLAAGPASGASIMNSDREFHTIIVHEDGRTYSLEIAPGQTEEFCEYGCFVTLPQNDDRVLTGMEMIEIRDGRAHLH